MGTFFRVPWISRSSKRSTKSEHTSGSIAAVLRQYCGSIAAVLRQYWSEVRCCKVTGLAAVLRQYCGSIASVLE